MAEYAVNILVVSPWLPHAAILHAGGQHLYHTLRTLSERGHTVYVLCYRRGESSTEIESLAALCASLTVVTPAYTWAQKLDHLRLGGGRRPWQLGRQTHRTMREYLGALCRDKSIDVVHLAWTETGRYLDAVPGGVGTVLGTLDVEYRVRPREVALYPPGWAKIQAGRRAQYLIRNERRWVRQAHITLACSEADRGYLAQLGVPRDQIHVVPPWIDAEAMFPIWNDTRTPGRLVFMGAMDRQANVAAARFLIEEVWPLVRTTNPDAALRIVGANPPDTLRRLADSDPHLTVTGFVPEMVAEWAAADVAVSPSLIGGGLVTKVAQPMAAGRPVVTTTLGNEGVAAPVGIAVEVADDAPRFAAAVRRLLSDREHWARLAGAGRRHVQQTLNWSNVMDRLEAAYITAKERV
jgi:glycosyltransferase involved in cell wall biosynthesis